MVRTELAFDEPNKRMRIASTNWKSNGIREPVWVTFYLALHKRPVPKSTLYSGPGPNASRIRIQDIAFNSRIVELETSDVTTIIHDAYQLWTAKFGEPKSNPGSSRRRRERSFQEGSEGEEHVHTEAGSKRKRQDTPTIQQARETRTRTSMLSGYESSGSSVYDDDARLPHDRNLTSNRSDLPIPEPISHSLSSSKRRQTVAKSKHWRREETSPTTPTVRTPTDDGSKRAGYARPQPNRSEYSMDRSNLQVLPTREAETNAGGRGTHRNHITERIRNDMPNPGWSAERREEIHQDLQRLRKLTDEIFEKYFPDDVPMRWVRVPRD